LFAINSPTRRAAPALFFVLMLAFAVCFWGLHYKLSLYHLGATQTASPAAKLLSQKERPTTPGNLDSARPTSLQPQSFTLFSVFLIASIAGGPLLVLLHWIWALSEADPHHLSSVGWSSHSVRPPPALPLPL
jgi:hypothetical protein